MKKISIGRRIAIAFIFNLFVFASSFSFGQFSTLSYHQENLPAPYELELCFDKTTHIIFPSSIKYVDLGNGEVIGDKVAAVQNILRLKANIENFKETNITVVTSDGKYYQFIANYRQNPSYLTFDMTQNILGGTTQNFMPTPRETLPTSPVKELPTDSTKTLPVVPVNIPLKEVLKDSTKTSSNTGKVLFENIEINETSTEEFSNQIVADGNKTIVDVSKNKIKLALNGLYVKDNIMFFKTKITNKSHIDYEIDFLRFFIKDKKVGKRTPIQEIEILPLYVSNEQILVKGKTELVKVFAIRKTTIPDNKVIETQLYEKSGGRHLGFKISNKDINNTKTL